MHRDELRKFEDERPAIGQMVIIVVVKRSSDLMIDPANLVHPIIEVWSENLDENCRLQGMASYWGVSAAFWFDVSDALSRAYLEQGEAIEKLSQRARENLEERRGGHVFS